MPKPLAGVVGLRKLVQQAVDQSSYRAVAEEIGMSQSGLYTFLARTRPHPATLKKVSAWAERQVAGKQESFDARDLDAAIALLVRFVRAAPNEKRAASRLREIVAKLSDY